MGHNPIEVAKTVLEVADVAWTAVELNHNHREHHHNQSEPSDHNLKALRSENRRLRKLLQNNLILLHNLSQSPALLHDCPPHLHDRLLDAVESEKFLAKLKVIQDESLNENGPKFPFQEASGADLQSAEVLINVDQEKPSSWVWVTDDMDPSDVEEPSGIDNEDYLVVTEDHVVDAVSNFMARCILSNPKSLTLTPQELQKTLHKALDGMNKVEKMVHVWHAGKMFYVLSTWGLAITGLYRTRAVLKVAALGIHHTSKVVLKAL